MTMYLSLDWRLILSGVSREEPLSASRSLSLDTVGPNDCLAAVVRLCRFGKRFLLLRLASMRVPVSVPFGRIPPLELENQTCQPLFRLSVLVCDPMAVSNGLVLRQMTIPDKSSVLELDVESCQHNQNSLLMGFPPENVACRLRQRESRHNGATSKSRRRLRSQDNLEDDYSTLCLATITVSRAVASRRACRLLSENWLLLRDQQTVNVCLAAQNLGNKC